MALSALPTSALSSLEAMLHSLMRESGSRGGGGAGGDDDVDTPIHDDTLSSSPPPPPLPSRPTPRGRRPSRPRRRVRVQDTWPRAPPPPPLSPVEEDVTTTAATEGVISPSVSVVEELGRKAAEAESRLREKEEENAALKRQIESYHVRWLEHEIRAKALEEAFHEQVAALQDAARMAQGTAHDRRGAGSSEETAAEEDPPPVRLWHGRDRMSSSAGAMRGAVGRLLVVAEFRRQSRTLEHAAEPPPWQPAAPIANSAADLKKLKAQLRAWAKDYKARLRRAQAGIGRDRWRRGNCWIRTST